MKCLNCSKPLVDLSLDVYDCPCGISYSKELVETADKKEWDRVRRWRLFSVMKDENGKPQTLFMYSIWANGKSKTVHPLHYKIHQWLAQRGVIKPDYLGRR